MGKINDWLWGDELIGSYGTWIVVFLVFLNLFFWFNLIPSQNCDAESCIMSDGKIGSILRFDNHNLSWGTLILSLVFLEIIFVVLLLSKQKKYYENWWIYTFKLKGLTFLYIALLWLVVFPLLWLIQKIVIGLRDNWGIIKGGLIQIVIVWMVIGLIVLWFLINYLLTKNLGKEKKRLFKEGEKVRVRKDLVAWAGDFYPSMEEYRGKKVTIKEYRFNAIYTKEDRGKNMWREEMFEKIEGK